MTWVEFDLDSALERDLMKRALPLVPTASDGGSRVTIDLAANTAHVAMTLQETLGPTATGCVELLGIRPLLVDAAWKVLDLLFETALDQSGYPPEARRGYTVRTKVTCARSGNVLPPPQLGQRSWTALTETYAGTVDLRHSLVHRRAHLDAAKAFVGVDDSGVALRPLTAEEQEAFVRAILRAAELVLAPTADERVEADLLRQLSDLAGIHGEQLPAVPLADSLPEITVIIDRDPAAGTGYKLDLRAFRAWQPFQAAAHADLIVRFRDRPGQELHGRLEQAPDGAISIDPEDPPSWLK